MNANDYDRMLDEGGKDHCESLMLPAEHNAMQDMADEGGMIYDESR